MRSTDFSTGTTWLVPFLRITKGDLFRGLLFIGTKGYLGAGAAVLGVVVAGRGRAAEGAAGGGAATPEEALYAVTTAWVTSVLGTAHMMMLFC